RWPACGRCDVLGDRPLALLPIARGPGYKVVDHPGGTRAASTHHAGRLSPYPPPDVLGASAVFHRPGARHPELGGRSVELDRVRDPLRASRPRGGEDDGYGVWRRIRGVLGTDEAAYSWRLVDNSRPVDYG